MTFLRLSVKNHL